MNVILQAFLHNPALRVYFLSDRHNRALCEQSQRDEKPCLSCEMDRLFSEVGFAVDLLCRVLDN
jgi:ubiquitin carboxyl-terminal hydrolase 22/27/51